LPFFLPILESGETLNKRQEYISLELSDEKLDSIVVELRDKLMGEFWAELPEGRRKDEIRRRIENNIITAFISKGGMPRSEK
jgi:hypothetical protein